MTTKFGFEIIVNDKTIWIFPENVEAALKAGQAKIDAGVVYAWSRGPGEEPLYLGTIDDLVTFISKGLSITGFNVKQSFDNLMTSLPSPINEAATTIATKVSFELDSLRLKIPAKGSTEKVQFEIAMIINLVKVELKLGDSLQLTRIYAQMGNFTELAIEGKDDSKKEIPPGTEEADPNTPDKKPPVND